MSVKAGDHSSDSEATWEGVEVLDIDDLTDRHEVAHLIWADVAWIADLQEDNADNAFYVMKAELSASPSRQTVQPVTGATSDIGDWDEIFGTMSSGEFVVQDTDDADLIGRPLQTTLSINVQDGTNFASPITVQADSWTGVPPGTWDFDRRDELFLNGSYFASGNASVETGANLQYQLVFGVAEG